MAAAHLCLVLGGHACCCLSYGIFKRMSFGGGEGFQLFWNDCTLTRTSEPLNHNSPCLQDSRLSVSDFKPDFRLCSCFQEPISSVEDKCYLDSRLSGVVHSDPGNESATPLPSSQVTVPLVPLCFIYLHSFVPLVINDNFNDVCSSLHVVQPSISSSLGISSQTFVTPDALPFEPNSFVTLHNQVYTMGQPNFLGVHLPVPTALNLSLWRSLLIEYSDVEVCNYLEFGWPIGYNHHEVLPSSNFCNHKGALDFPSAIGTCVRYCLWSICTQSFHGAYRLVSIELRSKAGQR